MNFGLFEASGPRLSKRRWHTFVRKRMVHIVIVALNVWKVAFDLMMSTYLGGEPTLCAAPNASAIMPTSDSV